MENWVRCIWAILCQPKFTKLICFIYIFCFKSHLVSGIPTIQWISWPFVVQDGGCNSTSSCQHHQLDDNYYHCHIDDNYLSVWKEFPENNFLLISKSLVYATARPASRHKSTYSSYLGWQQTSRKQIGDIHILHILQCSIEDTSSGPHNALQCFVEVKCVAAVTEELFSDKGPSTILKPI